MRQFVRLLALLILVQPLVALPSAAATRDLLTVVYDFTAAPPAQEAFADRLSDLVRGELHKRARIRVLERKDMVRLYADESAAGKLPQIYDDATAVEIGRRLRANVVVIGEISQEGDALLITARLVDVATSEWLGRAAVAWRRADIGSLLELASQVARRLTADLPGAQPLQQTGTLHVTAVPTESLARFPGDAARHRMPLSIDLPTGKHSVLITPDDPNLYEDALLEFTIHSGRETKLDVELERRTGFVALDAPQQARLLAGDRLLNTDPDLQQIPAGQYSLQVVSSDGFAYPVEFSLDADTVQEVVIEPSPDILRRYGARRSLEGRQLSAVPSLMLPADDVLVTGRYGSIEALDALSLERRWLWEACEELRGIARHGGSLLVHCRGESETSSNSRSGSSTRVTVHQSVYQLDTATGLVRASTTHNAGSAELAEQSTVPFVAVANEKIVAAGGLESPQVFELPKTIDGSPRWTEADLQGSTVVFSTGGGAVEAWDLAAGERVWSRVFQAPQEGMRAWGDRLALTGTGGALTVLGRASGETLCRHDAWPTSSVYFGPTGDKWVVVTPEGRYWLTADWCAQPVWRQLYGLVGMPITEAGAATGDQLYVVAGGYRLLAYDLRSGRARWLFDEHAVIESLHLGAKAVATMNRSGRLRLFARGHTPVRSTVARRIDEQRMEASQSFLSTDGTSSAYLVPPQWFMDEPVQDAPLRVSVESAPSTQSAIVVLRAGDQQALPPVALATAPTELGVDSDPSDAYVWVDGMFAGRTPLQLVGLVPGPHELTLFYPGFELSEEIVEVGLDDSSEQQHSVAFQSSKRGRLHVTSGPKRAEVYLDGELLGSTPTDTYDLTVGRRVQLKIQKFGYRSSSVAREIGSEPQRVNALLSYSPHFFAGGAFGATLDGPVPLGWPNESIGTDGVEGEPLPVSNATAAGGLWGYGEAGLWRTSLFATGVLFSEETVQRLRMGLRFKLYESRRFGEAHIGSSWLWSGSSANSSPPAYGGDETPLRFWNQPIPDVRVANKKVEFWLWSLRLRPRPTVFLEVAAGEARNGRLSGTALVRDELEDLAKDPSRAYDYRVGGGDYFSVELTASMRELLRIRALPEWLTLRLRYEDATADYGAAASTVRRTSLGIGGMFFGD